MAAIHILLSCGFFFLGAVLASFTGVVSERIYTGQSWFRGRSRCNSCRRQLDTLDLVPVISWLAFAGRCRTCRARVPFLYAASEAVLGLLFVLSYLWFGLTLRLVIFLFALLVLAFIVFYDLRHTIVPFWSSTLLILISGLFAWRSSTDVHSFLITLGGSAGIGILFFLVYALSRGRAMGLGDAPVAFALSLLVGAPSVTTAVSGLLYSFWTGAIIGVFILVFRRSGPTMGIEVPFVPFLAIGYLLAFFTQTLWNVFVYQLQLF